MVLVVSLLLLVLLPITVEASRLPRGLFGGLGVGLQGHSIALYRANQNDTTSSNSRHNNSNNNKKQRHRGPARPTKQTLWYTLRGGEIHYVSFLYLDVSLGKRESFSLLS